MGNYLILAALLLTGCSVKDFDEMSYSELKEYNRSWVPEKHLSPPISQNRTYKALLPIGPPDYDISEYIICYEPYDTVLETREACGVVAGEWVHGCAEISREHKIANLHYTAGDLITLQHELAHVAYEFNETDFRFIHKDVLKYKEYYAPFTATGQVYDITKDPGISCITKENTIVK